MTQYLLWATARMQHTIEIKLGKISKLNYLGDCDFVYYFAWVVVRIFENKVLRIFNVVCDEPSYLSGERANLGLIRPSMS